MIPKADFLLFCNHIIQVLLNYSQRMKDDNDEIPSVILLSFFHIICIVLQVLQLHLGKMQKTIFLMWSYKISNILRLYRY